MYLIGIAGGSGSGKSTFSRKVVNKVASNRVILLHQDCYYLPTPPKELYHKDKPNFDHPNSFDWNLLRSQLHDLKSGKEIAVPIYDYITNSRSNQNIKAGPADVCVFDGIYALWDPELRNTMDLKIYLDVDADIRFIRRLHRDVKERGRTLDSIISQYYDTVRPMHRQYLETTRQFADLVVGEETDLPSQIVAHHIKVYLQELDLK